MESIPGMEEDLGDFINASGGGKHSTHKCPTTNTSSPDDLQFRPNPHWTRAHEFECKSFDVACVQCGHPIHINRFHLPALRGRVLCVWGFNKDQWEIPTPPMVKSTALTAALSLRPSRVWLPDCFSSSQDRWSHPLLLAMFLLMQGAAAAATPWVPDVLLMGAVSGIAAFCTGAVVTGLHHSHTGIQDN